MTLLQKRENERDGQKHRCTDRRIKSKKEGEIKLTFKKYITKKLKQSHKIQHDDIFTHM